MFAHDVERRAVGALRALAIGDALGTPVVHCTSQQIVQTYGGPIQGFVDPVLYRGPAELRWERGEVTDDTMQTLALAKALVLASGVRREVFGRELLHISDRYCRPGKACGTFKARGDPNGVACGGTGNGAAMRIAPIGIAVPHCQGRELIEAVVSVSTLTHNTPVAIAGAVAIAAAVSVAVEGGGRSDVISEARAHVTQYEHMAGVQPVLSDAVDRAIVCGAEVFVASLAQAGEWGFTPTESVPCALAIIAAETRVAPALLKAVNLGGDADTVAAMVGTIAGALNPDNVPTAWAEFVETTNKLDLASLARLLVQLRCERRSASWTPRHHG